MPLGNFLSTLPWPIIPTIIAVVGFLGAILLGYGILLEAERHQDTVFVIGSACLFVYALTRGDKIIMFAMAGMFLVAGRELIQIWRGRHHHTTADMQKYEHPEVKQY